jgi:hypothetical protein
VTDGDREAPSAQASACQRVLGPGGVLTVTTAAPGSGSQLTDLAGHTVAAARAAGLIMTQPRPRVPLSQQIAADIRAKIKAGEYPADVALPSITKLAEQYGVATGAIQKALRILKAEGVVKSVPAYGTFPASK